MHLTRTARVVLLLAWIGLVLYPNPMMLWRSMDHLRHPVIDARAAAPLAARLPDDPRRIEDAVLARVVPYAYDWQVDGVPWYFPTTAEAIRAGRGDCESRALVLASVLAAKGIPHQLRLSFDHIWVDYPGKQPTAIENDAVAIAERRNGRFIFRWPRDFDLRREVENQLSFYWMPMPGQRKALLAVGVLAILLANPLLTALRRRTRATGGLVSDSAPSRV